MRAEVYPSPDGWRFRVKANNNEIMATGEAYVRRIDAESALQQLFSNGSLEVTVRNHGNEIVEHYMLGRTAQTPGAGDWERGEPTSLDEVYPGPFENQPRVGDTADPSGLTEEEKKLHYEQEPNMFFNPHFGQEEGREQ